MMKCGIFQLLLHENSEMLFDYGKKEERKAFQSAL